MFIKGRPCAITSTFDRYLSRRNRAASPAELRSSLAASSGWLISSSNELRFKYRLIWAYQRESVRVEKWTAPDVLKGLKKDEKKRSKKQGLVVFGQWKKEDLGV
ncbi:hypothetical protein TNCV_4729331 [Trichonephila clavipes]|nr:hypothetical protein TNCV_4729331 [Trichonephila clavipes]